MDKLNLKAIRRAVDEATDLAVAVYCKADNYSRPAL